MVITSTRKVKLFISWAHSNGAAKDRLWDLLRPRLSVSSDVTYEVWQDSHLHIGVNFRREILTRLDEADYTLQFLSPEFFASSFIRQHELPPFVGEQGRACLPVGLSKIRLDGTQDLGGLEAKQIFTLGGSFFSSLRGHRREEFANELAAEIRRRVIGDDSWRPL